MRSAAKRFGLIIGLVATVGLGIYAYQILQDQDLSRFKSIQALAAIAVASVFYATIIPISGWAWRLLLADLGAKRSRRELIEILAITQIAKYVPGNIGVHLGRVGMAIAHGIRSTPVVLSMLAETALAVAAALMVGTLGVMLSGSGSRVLGDQGLRQGIIIAACGLTVCLGVAVILRRRFSQLASRLAQQRGWLDSDSIVPGLRTTTLALVAYATNYVLIGAGIWGMAVLLLPGIAHDPGLLCASFALAWVAGFFTPGAPAGLGVREALMAGMLSLSYSQPDALVIVIALRLATIAGDAVLFAAGYLHLVLSRKQP